MGEHERFSLIGVKCVDEVTGGEMLGVVRVAEFVESCGRGQAASSLAGSFVFAGDVAGDAEGPGERAAVGPTSQVDDDTDEGFLGEVVGVVGARQRAKVAPGVGLDGPDEVFEGCVVAVRGPCREMVEVAHDLSVPGTAGRLELFAVGRPYMCMECSEVRELLSAVIDGEASAEEEAVASAHRSSCVACRGWFEVMSASAARFRVGAPESIPDLAPVVLARVRTFSPGRWNWVRWALAAVSLVEFASALPRVLVGVTAGHDSRHVGSFGAALAVGLLFVAWRPVRAYGVLPITMAAAVMMAVSAVIDVAAGRASIVGESHHVVEFAGLWLVWVLAGEPLPARLEPLLRRRVTA